MRLEHVIEHLNKKIMFELEEQANWQANRLTNKMPV